MNDFFDSLKEIKRELVKEQTAEKKTIDNIQKSKETIKENAIAHKQERLKNEFLDYVKNSDIVKI